MKTFQDVRRHGFMRMAAAVPKVALADPLLNVEHHLALLESLSEGGVYYVLFPELSLTGYSLSDLFFNRTLLEEAKTALNGLNEEIAKQGWPILVSVGMPLEVDSMIFNVAVTSFAGKILGVTPKSYLPNYREFYERRHFASASEALRDSVVFQTLSGPMSVPFGTNILFRSDGQPHFVLHNEICEDIWVPVPPSTIAALNGATVLANLSASNITLDKSRYRCGLAADSSAKNLAVQMYAAAGFGESTTDHAWDGDGYIAEYGEILAQMKRFQLDGGYIMTDVDLERIMSERIVQGTFRENAKPYRIKMVEVNIPDQEYFLETAEPHQTFCRSVSPLPFVPQDETRRDEHCREIFQMQATSLARRILQVPPSGRKLVIGVSGGQDSTLALLVAVKAMDLLKLSRKNIIALTMPGFGTTSRTKGNAWSLMKALGVTQHEKSIVPVVKEYFRLVGQDENVEDLVFENSQAWSRKMLELLTGAKEGGLVLGTGDLSELAVGWCTMYGDHASHYNPNAGVPKTLVGYLINWVAEVEFAADTVVRKTLKDILATEVSPELLRPSGDKIVQKTDEKIGPVRLRDFFTYYLVRHGMKLSKIVRLAQAAYPEMPVSEIKKWLKVFITRFFISQYKRSVFPDGPKIGLVAFSPRGDWRMPSDASHAAWLRELDQIPE